MPQPGKKPGTAPLPNVNELARSLKMLQNNLGAFLQCEARQDEQGKANASATVIGAYRKLTATYQALLPQAQLELLEPLRELHDTIVTIGIQVGPFRLKAPEAPPPSAPDEAWPGQANSISLEDMEPIATAVPLEEAIAVFKED